jgi:hypothetical protein
MSLLGFTVRFVAQSEGLGTSDTYGVPVRSAQVPRTSHPSGPPPAGVFGLTIPPVAVSSAQAVELKQKALTEVPVP